MTQSLSLLSLYNSSD